MMSIWKWIRNNPNRTMFLIPILLVAGISISHVVAWYDIANPMSWAIYLSIAIEVGAMTALVAATNKIRGGVWFMFGLITLIQMIGNIFFSYKEIDNNGDLFKSWVELTGPIWEMIGSDPSDVPAMKRWLAFLEGGLLPIISLTSLHFFVKYESANSPKTEDNSPKIDVEITDTPKTETEKVADKVWEKVNELREEGKLPEITEEDLENEPTALAFTPYEVEDEIEGSVDDVVDEIEGSIDETIPQTDEVITLSEKDSEIFMEEIENPKEPNDIIKNAIEKYKQSRGENTVINQPYRQTKTNIKRID
jgi:hypothetical protein